MRRANRRSFRGDQPPAQRHAVSFRMSAPAAWTTNAVALLRVARNEKPEPFPSAYVHLRQSWKAAEKREPYWAALIRGRPLRRAAVEPPPVRFFVQMPGWWLPTPGRHRRAARGARSPTSTGSGDSDNDGDGPPPPRPNRRLLPHARYETVANVRPGGAS